MPLFKGPYVKGRAERRIGAGGQLACRMSQVRASALHKVSQVFYFKTPRGRPIRHPSS
jgi:hypothetical protein